MIRVKGFWFLAKTRQKVVAIVTASQRFVYSAAYFVGFLYRVAKDIEDQRTEAELPPQKLYLPRPVLLRSAVGMAVLRTPGQRVGSRHGGSLC